MGRNKSTEKQAANRLIYKKTDYLMNRKTYGQMNGQTGVWTERKTYPRESNAANGSTQHVCEHCRIRVGSGKICIEVWAVPVGDLKQCRRNIHLIILNI